MRLGNNRIFVIMKIILKTRSNKLNLKKQMTKEGLVEAVMKDAKMDTKAAAQRAVEAVFDAITKSLSRGEEVTVTGFGTFRTAKSAARTGRNPKTGESIQIPASVRPKFKAGKALKDAVK